MHTMEFLIGFHSDRLSHLIHFVNKSGLLKRKENPSTCWCFLLYQSCNQPFYHIQLPKSCSV